MIYSNSKGLGPYNSLKIILANVNRLFLSLDVKVLSDQHKPTLDYLAGQRIERSKFDATQ